jgi:hypothetical protein
LSIKRKRSFISRQHFYILPFNKVAGSVTLIHAPFRAYNFHFHCSNLFISFIAVKDFPAALDCFQQAITAPAQVVSAVVIESIKKARLVSLIYYGVALDIPK